jgi:hypothetical protein
MLSYVASVTVEDTELFCSTNKARVEIGQALDELRSFLKDMSGLIDGAAG